MFILNKVMIVDATEYRVLVRELVEAMNEGNWVHPDLRNASIIDPENWLIGINAKTGYGKTYLSFALLKEGLKAGYKVYILTHAPESDEVYWNELTKYGDINLYRAKSSKIDEVFAFIYEIFKDKKGAKIIYINNLDLYLEKAGYNSISALEEIFSLLRKLDCVVIYEIGSIAGSIKGNKYLSLLDDMRILFLGRFVIVPTSLFNHLIIKNVNEFYNKLKDHEFLMLNLNNESVNFVKVAGGNIVEVPKDINSESETSDDNEYY